MRTAWRLEHFSVIFFLICVTFCLVDEEPLLDFSDFNLLHVWVLCFCAFIVYFDLSLRARFGQFLFKDSVAGNAAFVFS